jgi:hypothetical protein
MSTTVLQGRRQVPVGTAVELRTEWASTVETSACPPPVQVPGGDLGVTTGEGSLAGFLADPPFAIWATAAARKYGTSPLHALELLASALMEDAVNNGAIAARSR